MSENQTEETVEISLDQASPELLKVIEFEEVPQEMLQMLLSVHEVAEEAVRESWDEMPASAQKVLDNFEQFHALVSLSQSYAGVDFMSEFENVQLPEGLSDEEKEERRSIMLDQVLHNCVKDIIKQLKVARRKPGLKREFNEIFQK
ncbi:DUF3069 domain-containing protein [Aliivibrio kagoshimensis]|jgi:hypothetical protein|uniref:DUF3069 domain-containing protein n=1 Tax=Aliivibrio kagoshimensis TaxID=2910230 RepID=UPI003D129268